MKKLSYLLIIAIFLFIGCGNTVTPPVDDPNTDKATVKVLFPDLDDPSTDPEVAALKDYMNYYEVYFYNLDENAETEIHRFFTTAPVASNEISWQVPEGQYDVLLLTGYKYENPDLFYCPFLLASSYIEGQSIFKNDENAISMSLGTLDTHIICYDNVTVNQRFSVTIIIDTKNPLLSFELSHSFNPLIVYAGSFSSGILTHYFKDGNEWLFFDRNNWTVVAPDTPGPLEIFFWMRYRVVGKNNFFSPWALGEYEWYPDLRTRFTKIIEVTAE